MSDAPAIVISSNAAAVAAHYAQGPKRIGATLVQILRLIGGGVVSHIGREKLSGQILGVRTGTLRRALFYRVFVDANGLDAGVVVGADVKKAPQAAVMEFGGTITPKNGRYLAIPLGPALTAKGVARESARAFIANPQSLGFDHTFVNPRKTAIMGASKGQPPRAVFALKTSITVPEHSYLRAGVNERRAWILEQLGRAPADTMAGFIGEKEFLGP
jgi:hypothetical protein